MTSNTLSPKLLQEHGSTSLVVSLPKPRKLKALERNNLQWTEHKIEIREIYIGQDKTLKETMQFFKQEHQFVKSERKWKEKMKEWGFVKNIPARDIRFMAAKAEKRQREEGKDSVFYRNGIKVGHHKIENCKKQRISRSHILAPDIPDTPSHVEYHTPLPETDDDTGRMTISDLFPEVFEQILPRPDNTRHQGPRSNEMTTSSPETEVFATVALVEDHVDMDLLSTPLPQTDPCNRSCQCELCQKVADVVYLMDEVSYQGLAIKAFISKARTLDCRNSSDCLELQRHLSIVAQGGEGHWHYKKQVIQLSLICFAWELERYLDGGETTIFLESIAQLCTTSTAIFSSHPYIMRELLDSIICIKQKVETHEPPVDSIKPPEIELLQTISSSLLQLARACAFERRWYSTAGLFFTLLHKHELILLEIDRVDLQLEYCHHLERQQSWAEYLSAVHKLFKVLIDAGDPPAYETGFATFALDGVPRPLEQFMDREKVQEMLGLSEEVRKIWRSFSDWVRVPYYISSERWGNNM
ncbi:uncharacterized protein PAC_06158 [Phialocephala subalpina]|uniref:Clr5 domain-containing protein n=1 Tax=Phialocephala subalpina TaxID=576137 RepID=A0A1L7WU51_9HELO|nr:uncharacterized protein PAC_06158 [Phialocephala subalpina]